MLSVFYPKHPWIYDDEDKSDTDSYANADFVKNNHYAGANEWV